MESLKAFMVLQNCSATLNSVPGQMYGKESDLRDDMNLKVCSL